LRFNRAKYVSQIDLMHAAVQLFWPLDPPTDAAQRIARLLNQELNSPSVDPPREG
jgi:hypothetical protein